MTLSKYSSLEEVFVRGPENPFFTVHFCAGNLSETFLANQHQNNGRRHHGTRRETDVTLFVFLCGMLLPSAV